MERLKHEEMIEITKERYEELLESYYFLNALVAAGVDNWEGYGIAVDINNGEEPW